MKNEYEIRGETTAIFLNRKDGTALETLIDTKDFEKANQFKGKWYADFSKKVNKYYVKLDNLESSGKYIKIRLHRLILGSSTLMVDHINHDTLDNRRSNLREVTNQQNSQNKSGARKGSETGIRGVTKVKGYERYRVVLTVNYKKVHIGYFRTLSEAERIITDLRSKHMPYSQEAL